VALSELQSLIESILHSQGPSVVSVGHRWGRGSGIVIGPGRVLTNAHNVRGDAAVVGDFGGGESQAQVVARDVDSDLAVLSVEETANAIEWADTRPAIGSIVFAIANPGRGGTRVTHGFVSSVERSFRGPRGRRITGSIEHTAPMVRGSSGGALVDESGRLLGINTNRLSEGFYLAIPADGQLKERVDGLSAGRSVTRPRLGVGLAPAHVARKLRRSVGLEEADGLLVRMVEESSPAERAGVREGDLIVAAGSRDIADADDLWDALESAAGGSLALEVLRGEQRVSIEVDFTQS
jgi:S1-C subfamily serine protease